MSTENNVIKGEKYTFYQVNHSNYTGGSKIKGVYEEYFQASYHGLFVGQVLTLFGEENLTNSNEDLFSYIIAAEKEGEKPIYLDVYYGPSGPAIGGESKENYLEAAKELEAIIRNVKPKDCRCESVYEDLGMTIAMGTKDGVGFYETIGGFEDFEEFDEPF